ncbi:Homocysteine S-methyltransferase [Metschnikowia bicuspidata var. bicuspidata NRRL YB-4993]|uniref:Homocysteine S-methyltransferase n=1 Tax=Metschnikowia bicuspidata var. bicuspidata NRRL YB-4993 TaxID=869754 RepID=A0A1A0H5Q9_9ASCO|nr:Homocysteine S-methyltransferase [Metschnikowia bicuspidata var. bicuspidata NRRL YB-4993]OBA19242.1 Homocysteine S-methyltransferase [Metschnikowia bicuspidata var. bicuspidata NRRL YB-4993]
MSLKQVLAEKILIQDGSMGTKLENILPLDHPLSVKGSPLWSTKLLLGEPSLITQVHKSYVDAGCDMLITSTYQASMLTLEKHANMSIEDVHRTWQRSVDCAKEAINTSNRTDKIYIAGSIGPYGAFLANGAEYSGDYNGMSSSELANYHSELVKYFVENPDVDVIAFETIPNFDEVKGVFQLVKSLYSNTYGKQFYLNFSCKDQFTLADGTPLSEVVDYMVSEMAGHVEEYFVGTGCNCVAYEIVKGVAETVNKACEKRNVKPLNLIVYPNLGFNNDMSDPSKYGFLSDRDGWRKAVQEWLTVPNIRVIGGCCSTSPSEIAVIHEVINNK